jgi:tRNA pseudouridine38-40 synthase
LVRFGYDGSGYYGWARQPGARTVEGEIRAGLHRAGLAPEPEAFPLAVASRTDRGVSARANALALTVDLGGPALLRVLNGISPQLFFSAATAIAPDFPVRRAVRRIYRYFEPTSEARADLWAAAGERFQGRIDVRSLGRSLPTGLPCWRDVESVAVSCVPGGLVVEVRAPSFVWGMVRKIIGALRQVEAGRLTLTELDGALAGRTRLTLPMAEAEGLVLWEVEYPFAWEVPWSGPNRHQARFLAQRHASWWRQRAVIGGLEGLGSLSPPARRTRGGSVG